MSLTQVLVTITSDGREFKTRTEAEAHQRKIDRIERLKKVDFPTGQFSLDDANNAVVYAADVPAFIAAHGDAILEALTLPAKRGRKPAQKTAPKRKKVSVASPIVAGFLPTPVAIDNEALGRVFPQVGL